jgi:hypothetical protein
MSVPALALDPLVAKNAPPGIDPRPFLVSEKFDGVRALWHGKVLKFRSGRAVAAPAWFLAELPPQPLDGELWMGRRSFDPLSAAVRRTEPVNAEWRLISNRVFELSAGDGDFERRAARLATLGGGIVMPVQQQRSTPTPSFRHGSSRWSTPRPSWWAMSLAPGASLASWVRCKCRRLKAFASSWAPASAKPSAVTRRPSGPPSPTAIAT